MSNSSRCGVLTSVKFLKTPQAPQKHHKIGRYTPEMTLYLCQIRFKKHRKTRDVTTTVKHGALHPQNVPYFTETAKIHDRSK